MGFFRTFLGICSGTSIFLGLLRASLLRVLWHLLLLAFLCAVFIVAVKIWPFYQLVDHFDSALSKEFGGIRIVDSKVVPEFTPDKTKSFQVTEEIRFDYFPDKDSVNLQDLEKTDSIYGVVWTPGLAFLWVKNDARQFEIKPIFFSSKLKNNPAEPQLYDIEGLKKFIDTYYSIDPPTNIVELWERVYPGRTDVVKFTPLTSSFKIMGTIFVFVMIFIRGVFSVLFFASILSVVYYFIGKDAVSKLSMRSLLVVGIYTSFPALVVASLFDALALPFLEFQTVFLFGFLVYLFAVFNRLQRMLQPKEKQDFF